MCQAWYMRCAKFKPHNLAGWPGADCPALSAVQHLSHMQLYGVRGNPLTP